MPGLKDVRGKIALVTGASSGIGEGLARMLAERGAKVVLVARRKDRLESIAADLVQAGHQALACVSDIRDVDSIAATAGEVRSAWGEIDLLINSAGYARHILFVDHDSADIQEMMLTNYMGTVNWIKQVLPAMRERRSGWIVNVSSFAGKIGQADEAAYSASKFAVTGLSAGLTPELAEIGIQLLCVYPTLVSTEMFTPEVMARMPGGTKFIEPEEFARQTLSALAKGKAEAVIPPQMKVPIILSALFPEWMAKVFGRVKLAPLKKKGFSLE
jgi:short-subunit dehydrogenase